MSLLYKDSVIIAGYDNNAVRVFDGHGSGSVFTGGQASSLAMDKTGNLLLGLSHGVEAYKLPICQISEEKMPRAPLLHLADQTWQGAFARGDVCKPVALAFDKSHLIVKDEAGTIKIFDFSTAN